MRDQGLEQAIHAAGGVGALAKKIGISQPSVSNWAPIPAERVLAIEAITGVNRTVLRPDLFGGQPDVDEVDAARGREYALLSALLARAPDQAMLDRLRGFRHERPLARLRECLGRLAIERAAGQAEPKDHAAILCEIMSGLASGRFPAPPTAERELFEQHLSPWIGRFFSDLERTEADFYRRVGTLGRVFLEIETDRKS